MNEIVSYRDPSPQTVSQTNETIQPSWFQRYFWFPKKTIVIESSEIKFQYIKAYSLGPINFWLDPTTSTNLSGFVYFLRNRQWLIYLFSEKVKIIHKSNSLSDLKSEVIDLIEEDTQTGINHIDFNTSIDYLKRKLFLKQKIIIGF